MSYILDSLKKSEQERQQQSVVSPLEKVYDPSLLGDNDSLTQGVKKYVILGLVIVTISLLAVVAWWQFGRVQPTSTVEVTGVNRQAELNQEPTPVIKPTPALAIKPTPAPVEKVAAIDKTPVQASPNTNNANEIDQFYRQLAEAKKAQPVVRPKAAKKVRAAVQQKPPVAANQPVTTSAEVQEDKPSIPFFNDLSSLIKDKVPTISYSAHVFAENNNNGFVVINRKKSRVGTRLTNGIFIEKIEEDNVVLSYNGVIFKMPAMTSWVNN